MPINPVELSLALFVRSFLRARCCLSYRQCLPSLKNADNTAPAAPMLAGPKLYKQPDATQWIFGEYVSLFKPPMSFLEVLR